MIHFYFRRNRDRKIFHIEGELVVNEYGTFLVYSGNNTYCIDSNRFSLDCVSDIYGHEEGFEELKEINPLV